jgi:CIC family chloride channel protein
MTLDYGIVLPLMLACVVAYYTSRGIDARSIYSESLQRKEALAPAPVVSQPTVASLVKTRPVVIQESARFNEVVEAFTQHRYNFLYVIDADGRFVGAVSLHDIKAHLNDSGLRHLVIASELMHVDFPFLELDSPLGEALQKFLAHDGERLPVVDGHGGRMLVGTISKSDLLLSLSLASKPRAEPAKESASK